MRPSISSAAVILALTALCFGCATTAPGARGSLTRNPCSSGEANRTDCRPYETLQASEATTTAEKPSTKDRRREELTMASRLRESRPPPPIPDRSERRPPPPSHDRNPPPSRK